MKKTFFFLMVLSLAFSAAAQNKMISSKQLMSRELRPSYPMRGFTFVTGTNQIAYVQDTILYAASFAKGNLGKAKAVVTLSQLNKALIAAEGTKLTYIPKVDFLNAKEFTFTSYNDIWIYNTAKKTVTRKGTAMAGSDLNVASMRYAYSKDGSTLVINDHGKEYTYGDGGMDVVYGQSVHRNEFGINGGTFWSPKGNKLAFYRMDQSMVADYPMVKTSNKGIAVTQPFKYPMAGEKSHHVTVGIWDAATGKELYLQTRKDNSVAECENYLTNLTWSPDEKYLYIAKINRQQNHMWLERYNVETGKLDKVLFEEQNSRYVEPCEGLYFVPGNDNQFLWFSMRDGYKHLYLYNTDGEMIRQITHGEYEVEQFLGFDAKSQNFFVGANKENLIGCAVYKVNLASGEMKRVTSKEGTHMVVINKEGTQLIDYYSSVDVPARAVAIDIASGKEVELYNVANPLADYAMPEIKMGSIKADDGKTDLYYRMILPPNMEPGKKYPTLVYVYGGPHSQLVTDSWLGGGNPYFLFLAQQGYVVFTLDNRGTDNRGFEFESCTHRQLGTLEMADQMAGVRFLQQQPFVDKDRMGVEGWSFGGFMTISLKLAHPEIFKVACAGGPVIDWKWYEIMYGERYMDMPEENPEGYKNNSLLRKAKDLEGRLLVIHGAEDNTVVWQHSIEFIEACIKAGKQVDYFFYPHHEHNVLGYDRIHLYEKMFDYYETHLK